MEIVKGKMELGTVYESHPREAVGLILTLGTDERGNIFDEPVLFQGKERHRLGVDPATNEVAFGRKYPRPTIPNVGAIVVFERYEHYSAIPDIAQARRWEMYFPWWPIAHAQQLGNLKRRIR
jgi:hypothetical protein